MVVDKTNQQFVIARIVKELGSKKVNILVVTTEAGGFDFKELKFCNRQLKGNWTVESFQVRAPFLPAESISWDLNTEEVTVDFEPNGDILVSRDFLKTKRRKIQKITTSPI